MELWEKLADAMSQQDDRDDGAAPGSGTESSNGVPEKQRYVQNGVTHTASLNQGMKGTRSAIVRYTASLNQGMKGIRSAIVRYTASLNQRMKGILSTILRYISALF